MKQQSTILGNEPQHVRVAVIMRNRIYYRVVGLWLVDGLRTRILWVLVFKVFSFVLIFVLKRWHLIEVFMLFIFENSI